METYMETYPPPPSKKKAPDSSIIYVDTLQKMSLQALQERLATLQESTAQLRVLIERLAGLTFRPGSVPLGPDEENSVREALSAEIGQALRVGLEQQELLYEEVKYIQSEGHDKARLKDGVERLGSQLASYRVSFRKARIAAKKSLEQAQRRERELFIQAFSLRPASSPILPDGQVPPASAMPVLRRPTRLSQPQQPGGQASLSHQDRQAVGASSSVTKALRRTHDLIAAELARSEFAHQTLAESSAALKKLNNSYMSLNDLLANSRDLLGTLLWSQKSDTWYLQTALYMLLATGAWLFFRRILYGPMWWLLWLPLRILFGIGSRAGSAVIGGRRAGPGHSASIAMGTSRVPSVSVLPDGDLPTVRVASDSEMATEASDIDSTVTRARDMGDLADEPKEPRHGDHEVDAEDDGGPDEMTTPQEGSVTGGENHARDKL